MKNIAFIEKFQSDKQRKNSVRCEHGKLKGKEN